MKKGHTTQGAQGELEQFEQTLGYRFDDRSLLGRALTHRSYANEHPGIGGDNQRLEFLGDAVLGVIIAEALFRGDEDAPEGVLSRRLSELVCEPALVRRAEAIELGDYLRLGRGEEMTGGRRKRALLADAYEAVLGAVYLDGGHDRVRKLILEHFSEVIDDVVAGRGRTTTGGRRDYKSLLQREVQSRRPIRPHYDIVETSGPPHDRRFVAEVSVDSTVVGRGEGTSKQDAEQSAAAQAVERLEQRNGRLDELLDDTKKTAPSNEND